MFRFWNSFRYRLPGLLKHEYVALRFLSQASYEQAAQMRVSPAPDLITLVFMSPAAWVWMIWDVGRRRPHARPRRTARRSGRRSLGLTWHVRLIAAYPRACWSGEGWKSNEVRIL